MNISSIVTQLEGVTGLSGKVVVGQPAQTDSLSSGPACWITDLMESAAPSGRINQPSIQRIESRLGLVLGNVSLDTIISLRDAVRVALIDFQPDAPGDPIQFRSGRLEFSDAGFTLWRDEYAFAYYVDLLEQA